jgi:predicted phage tail protein
MMYTIHLGGSMGKKYGKTIKLDAANHFQLMRGLQARLGPAFRQEVEAGEWHLTDGPAKPGYDLGEEDIQPGYVFKHKHIHLLPAVKGASSALRVIVGVVLIVVGAYFGQGWLVAIGAGMAVGGIAEMLTKPPVAPTDSGDDTGSYIYNTAVNVTSQGGPIPIGYGRVTRASTVVITTDFSSDEITK